MLTGIKDIKARNEAFKDLTNEAKRKEIAYDSLLLLTAGTIKAARGSYWDGNLHELAREAGRTKEKLQCTLIDIKKSDDCSVCARGAMMLSAIRIGNNTTYNGRNGGEVASGSEDTLKGKGFEFDNFLDMEKEYETSQFKHPYNARGKKKLANICCNVIMNGEFNTTDKTDYLTEYEIKV